MTVTVAPDHLHLAKDGISVRWLDLNEGWNGVYDPTDRPLLRFHIRLDTTIYPPRADDDLPDDQGWYTPTSASRCTILSANVAPHRLRRALEIIHEKVQHSWPDLQQTLYDLIWLDPVDLDPPYEDSHG